ncbi:MAG: hypothetical protein WD965_09315, partial [Actinomycetota bacterium]
AAAVIQATVSSYLTRHEVVESELTRDELPTYVESEASGEKAEGVLGRLKSRWRRNEDDRQIGG